MTSDSQSESGGVVSSTAWLGSVELRKMRTPKSIPVGAVFEWEETLCRHRGTYREKKLTVAQVLGMNLLDTQGDYHYWTEIKHKEAVKCKLPNDQAHL